MTRARTRIKICGVARPADVDAAVDAGADAVGFVFHPASPRAVTVAQAAALARRLPPFVTPVGLFVDAPAAAVAAAVAAVPNLLLQFHGAETPAACSAWGRPFMKALPVGPGVDLLDFSRRFHEAAGLVLDAVVDGHGGGGKTFDWRLVAPALATLNTTPRSAPAIVLSGGLDADNVAAGMQAVRPAAVDVSSRVESSRGVKDPARIHAFCAAVRAADAQRARDAA